MSGGCVCREEGLQKFPWMDALPSGRLQQAGKDAVGFQASIRSGAEADFAEDHQMPEGLFRVIVGWRHAGSPEKSK